MSSRVRGQTRHTARGGDNKRNKKRESSSRPQVSPDIEPHEHCANATLFRSQGES